MPPPAKITLIAREAREERSGSVAAAPKTFSRVLPMFTRMPVMRSDRTRLERPYEMNGSVSQ